MSEIDNAKRCRAARSRRSLGRRSSIVKDVVVVSPLSSTGGRFSLIGVFFRLSEAEPLAGPRPIVAKEVAMDIYIGFDSAWTDNPKVPGAICAVGIEDDRRVRFHAPQLVSFNQALTFAQSARSENGVTLIALDQPTVVPNLTSMRPVERAAASLISWRGGGVQPANRGRLGMFCDASPIWRFLTALGAEESPERARTAANGLYVMEVFPALAMASLDTQFFGRLRGPRYNPDRRKTFQLADWVRVAEAAARESDILGCDGLAEWCRTAGKTAQPRKADQDKLDSVLCVLIALHWRLRPREASLLLGDLVTGYMVLPASREVREYLITPARKHLAPSRLTPRHRPRSRSPSLRTMKRRIGVSFPQVSRRPRHARPLKSTKVRWRVVYRPRIAPKE
jgi:predicted RNase H-like nuclease